MHEVLLPDLMSETESGQKMYLLGSDINMVGRKGWNSRMSRLGWQVKEDRHYRRSSNQESKTHVHACIDNTVACHFENRYRVRWAFISTTSALGRTVERSPTPTVVGEGCVG